MGRSVSAAAWRDQLQIHMGLSYLSAVTPTHAHSLNRCFGGQSWTVEHMLQSSLQRSSSRDKRRRTRSYRSFNVDIHETGSRALRYSGIDRRAPTYSTRARRMCAHVR